MEVLSGCSECSDGGLEEMLWVGYCRENRDVQYHRTNAVLTFEDAKASLRLEELDDDVRSQRVK